MKPKMYDFIIIGAGPAGLAAAQYGARSNLSTLVLENSLGGGQVQNIVDLENYPGIFPAVSGFQFTQNMKNQSLSFGAEIIQGKVLSIDKPGDRFVVKTSDIVYECLCLLVSTGADHRPLGVPGENKFVGKGVSYCATCDGPFFKNKKIIVIGGGDSACDEATFLSTLSDDVTLVHRKAGLRAQKSVAQRVLDNPKIKVVFNTVVKELKGSSMLESAVLENNITHEVTEFPVDGLFVFVGMQPRSGIVEFLEHDRAGYIITNEKMETTIKGLYVAGDIRAKSFRQVVTSCADGAIAAHSAREYISSLKNEDYT